MLQVGQRVKESFVTEQLTNGLNLYIKANWDFSCVSMHEVFSSQQTDLSKYMIMNYWRVYLTSVRGFNNEGYLMPV